MTLLCLFSKLYKEFKETTLHSRGLLSLEDVRSNLQVKFEIDNDLTMAKGSHQDVGLLVQRERQKERNRSSGRTSSKSKNNYRTYNYCKRKDILRLIVSS